MFCLISSNSFSVTNTHFQALLPKLTTITVKEESFVVKHFRKIYRGGEEFRVTHFSLKCPFTSVDMMFSIDFKTHYV